LRPVSHCEQETSNNRSKIDVLNDGIPYADERVELERRSFETFGQESEEDVIVG